MNETVMADQSGEARLAGRVALITGAASGIGEATARRFAAEGARVVLFDLRGEAAAVLADELGGAAVGGDAAVASDAQRAVAEAVDRFGALDVLVTCAGAAVGGGALMDLAPDEWEKGWRANLDTCMITTRAALAALIESRGAVVVVSSVGALSSGPDSIAYQTAKAALLGFTRSVAVDYGALGVRINAVCPGRTLTPMVEDMKVDFARARGVTVEEIERLANSVIPLRRSAAPAELAAVCLFLASEDASYLTGATIVADGGVTCTNVGVIPFLPGPAS
jgi:meso-butanediol dehydrogenase/(S,S)-butanediol dehydrogenase/diacetyl reductase